MQVTDDGLIKKDWTELVSDIKFKPQGSIGVQLSHMSAVRYTVLG